MVEKLRVVFWGLAGLSARRVINLLGRRGELVGAVEGVPRNSVPAENFYSGILGYVRRRAFRDSPYLMARALGLPSTFYDPANIRPVQCFLEATKPDVCVVASFPCLIAADVLKHAAQGFINVHYSLLPELRGPCGPLWECLTFSRTAGVTIHRVDAGEDTGDILAQGSFPVSVGMDSRTFYENHVEIAVQLLDQTLDKFKNGTANGLPQRNLPCSIRARRPKAGEDVIRWDWEIDKVHHILRTARMWYVPRQFVSGWRKFFDWDVLGHELCHQEAPYGGLRWDRKGFYLAHFQGKIRIRIRASVRRMLGYVMKRLTIPRAKRGLYLLWAPLLDPMAELCLQMASEMA